MPKTLQKIKNHFKKIAISAFLRVFVSLIITPLTSDLGTWIKRPLFPQPFPPQIKPT